MTVAIVLWNDRHADPSVDVFASAEQAIAWAKHEAQEMNRFGDLEEREGEHLTDSMCRSGWLYFATYGESNWIRVETKEVRS